MPDIFISYAHKDDGFPRYETRGWVEWFYEKLRDRMNTIRPGTTSIFLDRSEGGITGSSVLTQSISKALQETRVLLIIVSPAYLGSKWCGDELKFFCEAARAVGGLCVDAMCRVVKVYKQPVPDHAFHIPELDDSVGHSFFRKGLGGDTMELAPPHSTQSGNEFAQALNSLAFDLRNVLQKTEGCFAATASAPSVYLAATSPDLAAQRERVRTEFAQFGYTLQSDLQACRLSVHLIGTTYEPIVEDQYRLAGEEAARNSNFERLIWMPPGLDATETRQKEFLKQLNDEADPGLTISTIEVFKSLVHEKLKAREVAHGDAAEKIDDGAGTQSVYLIFDAPDNEATKPIEDWLASQPQGFRVWAALSRKDHRRALELSEGVLIYWGRADKQWLSSKLIDLEKFKRTARTMAVPLRGVMAADPAEPDRERKERDAKNAAGRDFIIVPGFGEFRAEMLEAFVRKLKASGGS